MHHLVYLSSAVRHFSLEELDALLEKSRHNNSAIGITGFLAYHDGNFFQVVEGEKEAVEKIFDRIQGDPRHGTITVLFNEEIPEREFGGWSMAYRRLIPSEIEGFDEILNLRAKDRLSEYPAKVRAFLKMFLVTL